ncbi:MAG TPA: NAD(P)H-binding protein [Acidimicrobiales bacterium]|nr:NAD(P)H-binding protein [Acidimicrobiales bacterium]
MATVLVTGGTGSLGRRLVPLLMADGNHVRVFSRSTAPSLPEGAAAVKGDISTGEGLADAVSGVDAVINAASSPFRRTWTTDVFGAGRLVEACQREGRAHLIQISIVGVDRNPFRYYRAKLAAEAVIALSGLPWTVVRATQFHDLLATAFASAARLRLVPALRNVRFQPVDAGEVAAHLVGVVGAGPGGHLPDIAGPEIRTHEELARIWVDVVAPRRRVVVVPAVGPWLAGFREGSNLSPDRAVGRVTFEQFLARQ